jgi:hypothetical protein
MQTAIEEETQRAIEKATADLCVEIDMLRTELDRHRAIAEGSVPTRSHRRQKARDTAERRAFLNGYLLAKHRMGRELQTMGDRFDDALDEVRAEVSDAQNELRRLEGRRPNARPGAGFQSTAALKIAGCEVDHGRTR